MAAAPQAQAEKLDNWTHMTSLIDHGYLFGHMGSIHPMDKTPVGKRLALAARQHAYGEPVISEGPKPRTATVSRDGNSLTITFDTTTMGPGGLLLRTTGVVRQRCPLREKQVSGNPSNYTVPHSQCGPATGFEVTTGGDSGRQWHVVNEMKLGPDGRSLVLAVPPGLARASITSMRYLFADWPTPTVYNSLSYLGSNGELPTAPFVLPVVLRDDSVAG